jgi:type IV pilus assembly protein PilW
MRNAAIHTPEGRFFGKLCSGNKGFTLIELLIALVIFSIIVALFVDARLEQQEQELSQQQALEMQQTARAAMMLIAKDLRMAGFDPNKDLGTGITSAGDGSTGTTLDLSYGVDEDGDDNDGDGDVDEEGELAEDGVDNDGDGTVDEPGELGITTVSYELLDRGPGGNPDGDMDLTVERGGGGGYQLMAENIADFGLVYLDADGNTLSQPLSAADRDDIRAVRVTITAGLDAQERDAGQDAHTLSNTRRLVSTIKCRNLGLN